MSAPGDHGETFPASVGRYELLLPIASGGMATVYLAKSRGAEGFERRVALKLVHRHLRNEPAFLSDLIEEAKLCARIRHPNVVPVLDVGQDPAGTFLVMEYVEGTTLSGLHRASRAAQSPLSRAVKLRILIDVLSGLHAAHEQTDLQGNPLGIVHRDFSPQNILVGSDGIARLTDFGIAKAASRISHTRTGMTRGKLAYMAPEQSRGRKLDRRADVWSAGVVAWELVAGRRLFKGDEAAIARALAAEPIPSLAELDPELDPGLARAIASALERDPARRTESAKAFRDALVRSAKGSWSIADSEEVSTTVAALVSEEIEARRARAEHALALRQEASRTLAAVPTSLETARADDPPELSRSFPGVDSATTERLPLLPEVQPLRAPALSRPRAGALALAVATTLLVGVALGLLLLERAAPPRAELTPEPALVTAPSVAPEPSAPEPPREPSGVAPAATPATTSLAIESNLPIRAVSVDGVEQRIEPSRTKLELRVSPGPHDVQITSKDGRSRRLSGAEGRVVVRFVARASTPLVSNPY